MSFDADHEEVKAPEVAPHINTSTCRVYLEYDDHHSLPAPPSLAWTRFVCISDTHSQTFPVPAGDVLFHSGDLTNRGSLAEFQKTLDWICALPHPVKIVIAGNHDVSLHRNWFEAFYPRFGYNQTDKPDYESVLATLTGPKALSSGVVYLQDSSYTFRVKETGREWRVYGSPWQPKFGNWAFNYSPGDHAKEIISSIPPTDILLTHGPPHGILDGAIRSHTATPTPDGCPTLRAQLSRIRPCLHVFGHIHEARGAEIHHFSDEEMVAHNVSDEFTKEDDPLHASPGSRRVMVAVNAANAPGIRDRDAHARLRPPGGPGWQPIVVDLLDVEL